jgi:hypothetical protein
LTSGNFRERTVIEGCWFFSLLSLIPPHTNK